MLMLAGAKHEVLDGFPRVFAFFKNQFHLLRDGHFNAMVAGGEGSVRRVPPSATLPPSEAGFGKLAAFAEAAPRYDCAKVFRCRSARDRLCRRSRRASRVGLRGRSEARISAIPRAIRAADEL
jgi:hypothetical protein